MGLQDCVKFRGQVPQAELAAEMRGSQAFVFPSLREFGGGVILEAMACALPCLIVDYGGPGELVSDETGVKLPMRPREELVESLRIAMEPCQPIRTTADGWVRQPWQKFERSTPGTPRRERSSTFTDRSSTNKRDVTSKHYRFAPVSSQRAHAWPSGGRSLPVAFTRDSSARPRTATSFSTFSTPIRA